MQELLTNHPALSAVGYAGSFVLLWSLVGWLVAALGGWHSLAERFRTEREFPAHKRWMQSATMRFLSGYNHVLTLGSDQEGIYMGALVLFRMGHPRLFIPWSDVRVEEPRQFLFLMMQTLRLGPDGIPLRVRESLAQFLLESRGGMDAASSRAISPTF